MKVYIEESLNFDYEYFYDWHIQSWTILKVEKGTGYQIGDADYCSNRKSLLANYNFTFKVKTN